MSKYLMTNLDFVEQLSQMVGMKHKEGCGVRKLQVTAVSGAAVTVKVNNGQSSYVVESECVNYKAQLEEMTKQRDELQAMLEMLVDMNSYDLCSFVENSDAIDALLAKVRGEQ